MTEQAGNDMTVLVRRRTVQDACDVLRRAIGEHDAYTLATGGNPGVSDRWAVTADMRRVLDELNPQPRTRQQFRLWDVDLTSQEWAEIVARNNASRRAT